MSSTTQPNTNLKYFPSSSSNSVIRNLPLLIKGVDEALLKTNKKGNLQKYRKKKYIGKDKVGYYIM